MNLSKWYITRSNSPDGCWCVCPPISDDPNWSRAGAVFNTGTEALAAFAAGGVHA